jgi:hypothetical protein
VFSTGLRARRRPVGLIALWNCRLMQMVAADSTAALQSCFGAVGLTPATSCRTSFGDERVRAWGEVCALHCFFWP